MSINDKIFLSYKYMVNFVENDIETTVPVYIALLADGTENNIKLPQDVYEIFDGLGQGTRSVKTYYASFEFEERADVCVKLPVNTKSINIKPKKYNADIELKDNMVHFSTDKTVYLSIECDGDIFGAIHVICNKREFYKYDKPNVIKFENGIYTSENCKHIHMDEHGTPVIDSIPDDTIVYIGEHVVVNAAIELKGVKNVRIIGTGTISLVDRCHGAEECFEKERYWGAFRYYAKPNILIRSGCENIEIDGVLLNCEFRGIVIRNSENIVIKNVKMFSSTENADGINCYNTSSLLVDNCYIQSADDCFCMYNSCDSIPTLFDEGYDDVKAVCRNVEVKNCIMSSNARPVVLGGHATGCKEPRCIIEDVHIHDCEVVGTPYRIFGNTEEYAMYWSGFMRILSQSEQIVRRICFENITVDVTKGHNGKIFHIEVRGQREASYTESKGFMIEDLQFNNINILGSTEKMVPSVVRCRQPVDENDNPMIRNVVFNRVNCKDMGFNKDRIIIEGPVNNLTIS